MKSLKFAFIQSGYCVFGVGYTREQAIADASVNMDCTTGARFFTYQETEAMLVSQPNDGDMRLIESSDEEFDSYLRNQGGFVKRGRGWYHQK